MKLGTVIGRVTLSRSVDALQADVPHGESVHREQYAAGLNAPLAMGREFSLVVYDNLGGGVGQVIGYEEGREAAQPFDRPTPIDAINCALIDEMFYQPWKG